MEFCLEKVKGNLRDEISMVKVSKSTSKLGGRAMKLGDGGVELNSACGR